MGSKATRDGKTEGLACINLFSTKTKFKRKKKKKTLHGTYTATQTEKDCIGCSTWFGECMLQQAELLAVSIMTGSIYPAASFHPNANVPQLC